MGNQLDKIIITAMDRFVWFVLLVVMSHLVTEFTRATGYTRGARQDLVTANDSSIQPIRVQSLVMYPGQEYRIYGEQNQQYYSGNSPYNNYANNNSTNNSFLSSLFNQLTNNSQHRHQQPTTSISVNSNNLLNLPGSQTNANIFSFRPLIDSIFEIPLSTLRAVNNLVRRLTGGFLQPQKQQDQQPQQLLPQQQPTKYFDYPSYPSAYQYYGMQRSPDAIKPKSQFEMLNRKRPSTEAAATPTVVSSTSITISSLNNGGLQR